MENSNQNATDAAEDITAGLFAELMRQFYDLGWMRGSSGGMAVWSTATGEVFCSPSSVQKERLREHDLFVYSDGSFSKPLRRPRDGTIKESACVPVFRTIFEACDTSAVGCVIHTHSKYSNLLTQLTKGPVFQIANQEMIKGIRDCISGMPYANTDTLTVPIIENQPLEDMLQDDMKAAIKANPHTCAVLVRNHGLFVWGTTWQKTKIM
ncbi:Class II aldolase/adducin N-terminal [Aphelenchoides avenae]|nr:Class II aldolase/adducin N-terminal [Aphelenchus avenae]